MDISPVGIILAIAAAVVAPLIVIRLHQQRELERIRRADERTAAELDPRARLAALDQQAQP